MDNARLVDRASSSIQSADHRPDARTGVVAYQSLTGHLPFASSSPPELARAVLEQAPLSPLDFRPELGLDVGMVLLRALAKTPKDRFATCGQFAQALIAAMSEAWLRRPR